MLAHRRTARLQAATPGERPWWRSQSGAMIDRAHVLIVGEPEQGAPRYLEVSKYD
jgi:hypothetical protein